jgi:hypothetical protein
MAKAKPRDTGSIKDLIVIWWDGYGKEHRAADKKADSDPFQWEFDQQEAEALCRKQISKGALRAEVWRPVPTPEKTAAFERTRSGTCNKIFPGRF